MSFLPRQRRTFIPQRVVDAAQAFVGVEAASGAVLLLATIVALVWVNSPWGDSYADFWHGSIELRTGILSVEEDLKHAVNDGLMTLFFFLVGLEIKRELVHGELSDPRRAVLPATAALGGMVVPALIYAAFNAGGSGADGWGIPMATDIAFALGVLSLLGRRVPFSIKVFLLALAIADDIGAIVVIAIFYTSALDPEALFIAACLFSVIVIMNRGGVRDLNLYVLAGVCFWLAVFESGIHATLSGVALGLLTPASAFYQARDFPATARQIVDRFAAVLDDPDPDERTGLLGQMQDLSQGTEAPLDRIERRLHPWVSYGVVPVFALANAGVEVSGGSLEDALSGSIGLGVALGLLLGKPIGIFLFTWLAVKLRLCELPRGATWGHVLGVGALGGIGFTVSLLITDLAFRDAALIEQAKLGVLCASAVAGTAGLLLLRFAAGSVDEANEEVS